MLQVLRYLGDHFTPAGVHRLDTPFDVPGLDFESKVGPALRRLAADPPLIHGVMVDQADYPVVVTGLTNRGWETLEEAGDPRDASPGQPAGARPAVAMTTADRPFAVALSFAGEQRSYVQQVATRLDALGIRYFYDDDEAQKIWLWGKNLGEEFQRIYTDDSHAVVMFVSKQYAEKPWTTHERRSALTRALRERREYVLPVRFDETELAGLDPDAGYLRASDYSPDQLAGAIARKLLDLGGIVPATTGPTVTWARATKDRTTADLTVAIADEDGSPVSGASVLAVAPNGTRVSGITATDGRALIRLPGRRLVTIYCAADHRVPGIVRDYDPVDDLEVTLPLLIDGGSAIFEAGTGYLPGLDGRLNPIRDTSNRLYLYADNISINDSPGQPSTFQLGQPIGLEDAHGSRLLVTVIEIIGWTSLLRYER